MGTFRKLFKRKKKKAKRTYRAGVNAMKNPTDLGARADAAQAMISGGNL